MASHFSVHYSPKKSHKCMFHFDYHSMQVLTSNIGHILGKVGVENGLDEFRNIIVMDIMDK